MAKLIEIEKKEPEEYTECLEAPRYSCALGGAIGSIVNIHRAIPIIHAGAGCGFAQSMYNTFGSGSQGIGYIGGGVIPSTNISEKEVIFGGEGRLREQIQATIDLIDGDIFIVTPGCIPNMIGDDIDSIVKEFTEKGHLVINAGTSGFKGNTFLGYELVLRSVAEQLFEKIDKETIKEKKIKGLVNILGIVPYNDIFWRGDLKEIKRILEKIGLQVNVIFGDFGGVDNLKKIPYAELNIVISPWVGVETAKIFEERFGTHYLVLPMLPTGPADTSRSVRTIGNALNLQKEIIEQVISDEERDAYQELDIMGDTIAMFSPALPFAIVSNSASAIGLTRFLANEAGFTPTVVIISDNPPEEVRETITQELSNLSSGFKPKIIFEADSWKIREYLKQSNFRLLLGSPIEKHFALDRKLQYLSVSFPANDRLVVGRSYAGYKGGTAIVEDILSKFLMPF